MPLSMHSRARPAHAASEAAAMQGKFWEFHDKIFSDQRNLTDEQFVKYAEELGLDVEKFKKDLASAEVAKRLDQDVAQAGTLGVTGTPAFFINGRYLSGAQPFANFKRIIDEELKKGS